MLVWNVQTILSESFLFPLNTFDDLIDFLKGFISVTKRYEQNTDVNYNFTFFFGGKTDLLKRLQLFRYLTSSFNLNTS